MNNPLAASQNIMKNYLSELMTDDDQTRVDTLVDESNDTSVDDKRLTKLLQPVNQTKDELLPTKNSTSYKIDAKQEFSDINVETLTEVPNFHDKTEVTVEDIKKKSYRKGSFQAMFFEVAGLIIAVPLIDLGGIYNINKTTSLSGKPDWFKGVMLYREDKINVVDTALWVMPEKCDTALVNSLNYQYVIMLDNSKWGLMAEHLVETVTLDQDDVKWLDNPIKRPWLAGLVKERMCVLLNVEALIKLLDNGAGVI
jgi:purine-binding chemotaxis protein CheW